MMLQLFRCNLIIIQLIVITAINQVIGRNSFEDNDDNNETTSLSSNLGCFLCTQLLSVTQHQVGLSETQLKSVLDKKCTLLPDKYQTNCIAFVDASLPEIYFSLNYDLSSNDVCITLNLCNNNNAFATIDNEDNNRRYYRRKINNNTIIPSINIDKNNKKYYTKTEMSKRRPNCRFCERMLTNAKNYAITAKNDIKLFANSVCSKLPSNRFRIECYQLSERKISELSTFVDKQMLDALLCVEMNQCQ